MMEVFLDVKPCHKRLNAPMRVRELHTLSHKMPSTPPTGIIRIIWPKHAVFFVA
jgi:hypothetical protein